MKLPLESDIELIGNFNSVQSFPSFEYASFRASVWQGERLIAEKIEIGEPGKCNAIARLRSFIKKNEAPDLKPFDFRLVYQRSLIETRVRERLQKSVFIKSDDKLSLTMSDLLNLSKSETQEIYNVVKHWSAVKSVSEAWYVTSLLRGMAGPVPLTINKETLHAIMMEAEADQGLIIISKKYDNLRKDLIKNIGHDPKSLYKTIESVTDSKFMIENRHLFPMEACQA